MTKRVFVGLALSTIIAATGNQCLAQNAPPSDKATVIPAQAAHHLSLAARIKRQYARIDQAVGEGKISPDKAGELKANPAGIENNIAAMKQAGGGTLNKEQIISTANQLKQSFNQILTAAGAGSEVEEGADVLGPTWKAGQDGAQDPKALLKQMKSQEKRALRQQRQAAMQALEQQQLQYEKEMINTLGKQKPAIEESKSQLQQVRQQAGAN